MSSDTYKFSKHRRYVVTFRESMRNIGRLRCDVLITPHPSASNLYDRVAGKAPLVDRNACKAYSERGLKALEERLAKELAK